VLELGLSTGAVLVVWVLQPVKEKCFMYY
jgi:hypothetical protein